jgi:hypothetical protein
VILLNLLANPDSSATAALLRFEFDMMVAVAFVGTFVKGFVFLMSYS